VQRIEHKVTEVSADGRPVLADGQVLDVANIVWATGFRPDFSWIEAPITYDEGWPREYRGVVEGVPGLFFCGLAFQFAFASMVLPGIGRDAAHVAKKIGQRAPARVRAAA
jgi:putative flavoprotein involved in K+ transport